MGGVCSKSDTKKAKDQKDVTAAGANETANAANATNANPQPSAAVARRDSDPHYPVPDSPKLQGNTTAAGAAAATGVVRDTGSNFTLSTTRDESKGEADTAFSPINLNSTKQPAQPSASAACPPPAQKGENYDQWFPPEHDRGMKLGDGKYTGVGVESPSSSAELHSLASTPNYRVPSPAASSPPMPSLPPPPATASASAPRPYDPMRFVDEDSAAPETASSAFVTPRELRDGGSVADNVSLVSHGSMMSQHAHGYRYYNSSNTGNDGYPTPSSRRQSIGSASLASAARPPPSSQQQRSTKTAMTVTNVRTNRQMPAAGSVGGVSPFSRQTSRAGSDRFQSCRSIGDASTSAASYLPPTSPGTAVVTEADVLLLSAQQGGNYSGRRVGGAGSPLSAYPASASSLGNGNGEGAMFYSCRSFGTASEQSAVSPSMTPGNGPRGFSPITLHRLASGSSLHTMNTPGSTSVSNLRGAALPPRSPGGSPMLLAGTTLSAQQAFLQRQASRQSTMGDAPASEAFFSVGGSSHDVFLDLPTATETSTVYNLDDDRDLELTLGARGQPRAMVSGDGAVAPASPASHYSSVAASPPPPARAQETTATTASSGMAAESLGTPTSGSASSAWLAGPAVTSATKLPRDRQRRTTAPHVDDATPVAAAGGGVGADGSASDYDADRSSVATSRHDVVKVRPAPVVAKKPYYTKADFPPNPHTPPQAAALRATLPAPAPAPTAAATGEAPVPLVVEMAMTESTYVTLSTPSEASTRKSGASRPTVKYPGGEDLEIDGDESGDAVRRRALEKTAEMLPSPETELEQQQQQQETHQQQQQPHYTLPTASSSNSFSTVASSYRREPPQQQQQQQQPAVPPPAQKPPSSSSSPNASQVDDKLKTVPNSTGGAAGAPPARRQRPQPKASTRRGVKRRSSLQRAEVATDTTSTAAAPAPVMTNPNPWVPGGTNGVTASAHVDPFVFDGSGQPHPREASAGATPASATTPRTSHGGRGRPVRRSVTPISTTGRASITPGRRTTLPATPGTTAAARGPVGAARSSKVHTSAPAERPRPSQGETPSWSSLTPTPETTSSAKPISKLAVAAKARKTKKSAAAAAAAAAAPATPPSPPPPALQEPEQQQEQQEQEPKPSSTQVAGAQNSKSLSTPLEGGESVVEYELFTGELADVEADSTADDTLLSTQKAQQPQLPQVQGVTLPRTPPRLRAEHRRAGFHVSPEASPTVLTSAETSGFMRPFDDAQLAAEMNGGDADDADGEWMATGVHATTTTTTLTAAENGVDTVVTRVETTVTRRLPDDNDEGYDADSGMPSAPVGSLLKSPPAPRSVSATSNEDVVVQVSRSVTTVVTEATNNNNQSAPQLNSAASSPSEGAGGRKGEASGLNAVELSSSSAASETDFSTGSPVIVG